MTPEQQKSVLELAPTQDLLVELIGRYDHVVFYGLKDREPKVFSQRFAGDKFVCLGMCSRLDAQINLFLEEQQESISPDDL